jgi:SynChlorMet cassette radical SAM/SPASM protein ScmF
MFETKELFCPTQGNMPPKPRCGYYLGAIYFYILEGCNLKCRHCWINPPFESEKKPKFPFVDIELFKHIVEQALALGLQTVKLTGGEPLIHPEIEKVLEYIHYKNLKLNIETNGVAITPELAKLILASKKRVNLSVSIDSHKSEIHEWVRGVEGSFNDAVRGVKIMVEQGFRPQVIMSVMKKNYEDVEGLVELAESIGAGSVKFNLVTPTARGEKMHERGEVLTIEELIELGRFVSDDLQTRAKIPLIYSHPPAFRTVSHIKKRPRISGCGIFRIIGVLGNGKYALCGIGESLPDFVFGDAKTDRLEDVWNDTPMLNRIRTGLPSELKGICSDCLMRKGCLGSCIANNYYAYGDLFAPHRYCQLSWEEGLFPKTRLVPGSKHDNGYVEREK